jgi:hypothetical protein
VTGPQRTDNGRSNPRNSARWTNNEHSNPRAGHSQPDNGQSNPRTGTLMPDNERSKGCLDMSRSGNGGSNAKTDLTKADNDRSTRNVVVSTTRLPRVRGRGLPGSGISEGCEWRPCAVSSAGCASNHVVDTIVRRGPRTTRYPRPRGDMTSLSRNARVAGLLYISSSLFGLVRLIYIPSALIVQGNASVTASNIAGHELLFRFGIVSYLLCSTLWIFVTLALYRLLKRVDQALAVLMIMATLMYTPIFFVNAANDVAALLFVRGADFLSAVDKPQRDAFAMVFLDLHRQLDLIIWTLGSLWFIPFGLLVFKSRFLPRVLGVWLMIVSVAYLAIGLTGLLDPAYGATVAKVAQPFLLGEVAVMLWLAIMGAKEKPLTGASAE